MAISPNPKPDLNTQAAGSPTGPDPNFNWHYWMSLDDPLARPPELASQEQFPHASGSEVGHVQQPDPGLTTGPDPDFDWKYWASLEDTPPQSPAPLNMISLGPEYQQLNQGLPNLRVKTKFDPVTEYGQPPSYPSSPYLSASPTMSPVKFGYDVPPPSPFAMSPTRTEIYSYSYPGSVPHSPSSPSSPLSSGLKEPENEAVPNEAVPNQNEAGQNEADQNEADLQAAAAARYAAKGKAKVLRHIPGTARDVGNAAQAVVQPV
jgi:hypothetical protein